MIDNFLKKIKKLPKSPGVYLFRNKDKKIIYVGKAVNLKNRVSSYFSNKVHDSKTAELVKNIIGLEWIETEGEFEALILEADLIKRYKPKYNIRFKDDKNYVYLKITKEDYPRVLVVHQALDSEAEYIGPFTEAAALKKSLKLARYIYPYCTCSVAPDKVCLYFHLGLCLGHGKNFVTPKDYQENIKGIKKLFSKKSKSLLASFKREMNGASLRKDYERAARFRDKLSYLKKINKTPLFSSRDLTSDTGLLKIKEALDLEKIPRRIECFDISNIMGTSAVGSMVVFVDGVASPKDYRRFQVKTVNGANDFAMMGEVLNRRFKASERRKAISEKGIISKSKNHSQNSFAELPDLVILDGGKGQLSTVLRATEIPKQTKIVALAKRFEDIVTINNKIKISNNKKNQNSKLNSIKMNSGNFQIINLEPNSEALFLVQRIRDEAHRFAITYHRKVRSKEFFETSLDSITGVGPKTIKKLIREFGSIVRIRQASIEDLSKIISSKLAKRIKEQI